MKLQDLTISLLIASLLVLSAGCERKGIYKTFETEYTFKVRVPANSILSLPLEIFSHEQESDASNQYEINDTRKDLVEEVYLQSFWVEVEEPANEDLSFLNSAEFFIDAEDLPEILIAGKNPVPENVGNELAFDIEGANFAEYVKKEPFEVRANIVTDENRTRDIVVIGRATFSVTAKIIGL